MEPIDSSPETDLQIVEKSNMDSMFDDKDKEDNYNNDTANKELECDEDDKVVLQNNTNLELHKQKLILYNNLGDEDIMGRNSICKINSTDISYATTKEQENRASPQNDDPIFENNCISDNSSEKIEMENNCNKEVSEAEKDSEHNTQNDTSNLHNEIENFESSFHTTFSETSFGTNDSDNLKHFQSNTSEEVDLKPSLDYFPAKKPPGEDGEAATTTNENDADTKIFASENNFEESDDTKLGICSPKVNGNHKEVHNSTCDSPEQNYITIKQNIETEKTVSNSEINPIQSKADIQLNDIFSADNTITKHKSEILTEQSEETTPSINIINNESRCSTPDSVCSSSSAHSSSSQHLVIDHPANEKVSTLRMNLKRKHSKISTKKRLHLSKNKVTVNTNSTVTRSPASKFSQNVEELEIPSLISVELPKMETGAETNFTSSSSLNEQKYIIDEHCDEVIFSNDSSVPHTEESTSKSTPYLPCDCNKTSLGSANVLNSHVHTCPSYKSNARNYYKCISCGTYHENWSFFLHIREQHNRFLCLYCIKCFPTAEKLSLHLEIKHDLEQNHFNSEESFRNSAAVFNGYALETRFLMCCTCQHIFDEKVAFTEHVCMEYMKSCVLCGQKGRHTNQCKAHPFVKRRNKKKVKEKQSLQELPTPTSPLTNTQEDASSSMKPITHNEDSNSSSNMVIDESCTTNHSLSGKINTFKVPEEPECFELPLDTRQEQSPQPLAEEPDNTNTNFLKFKLRVPKEFQKPVDAAISSSESDDGAYEDELRDEGNQQNTTESILSAQDFKNPSPGESTAEQQCNTESNESATSAQDLPLSKTEGDEESVDEEDTNPHLTRILQEIEQTKLDIKRTKETMHQVHAQKVDATPMRLEREKSCSLEENEREDSACPQPVEGNSERNWTPTPPASPKLTENTNEKEPLTHATAIELEANEDKHIEGPSVTTESENSFNEMQTEQRSVEGNIIENDSSVDKMNSEPNEPNTFENNVSQKAETNINPLDENKSETQPVPPSDGIEIANEDCLTIELQLDRPIEKYEPVEFVRTCLKASYPFCLYCNHARRIAVNGEGLVLHLIAQHRFSATVDSITAEELQPETIVAKLKSFLPQMENEFFNTNSYCTIGAGAFTRHFNERIFECFQCRFVTTTHKELYLHNRKMHLRTAILCFMCRCNFFSFSEILCHICPGKPHKLSIFDIKFRCCLCDLDNIPSPFRLMVHLRKRHFACDICLEDCRDQSKLSSHVWKHKLHHLCYRCGIAYRNKMDITKHLFWKHGTESAICKTCLNKRWPHVYHFCVPPSNFICEVCQHGFTKAMYLTVHKRIHLADFRYPCTEENCEEKFISRKLLLKHAIAHQASEVEKGDFKENSNANELFTLDIELKKGTKDEREDTKICEVKKSQTENSEAQTDQKIKQESESCQQSQDQPVEEPKPEVSNNELVKPPQKKKKKKRSKESLEDLNLTAPNLSESGSSSDSESETKSKYEEEESKVVLSPPSENGDTKEQKLSEIEDVENPGNVLDIWKNFLQSQQVSGAEVEPPQLDLDLEDKIAVAPKLLHVCYSDHDYCKMIYPAKSSPQNKIRSKSKSTAEKKRTQSLQKLSSRKSNASSSSSDESSDTSSSSSCSCGSNCSCSGGSSSSSSSSSSENSDSSAASRKRQRKKSERNSRHKKSESISPRKNHTVSEIINVTETDENTPLHGNQETENSANIEETEPLSESFVNESDLETVESETDEEYYDEHPQKLASELLSQKRAQLMARTFLSPSHNFDIVENSRPSTPSLPEDVVFEKRKKKKKRDRKSTSKSNILPPKFKTNQMPLNDSNLAANITANEVIQSQYLALGNNFAETTNPLFQQVSANMMERPLTQQPQLSQLGNPRMSEGSSCSDVDGSLKRSKRARRPNKFYGYTSDDESMGSAGLGQSLLIGMRAFKPQPPPQLVWHKEDLPTPSKSILNNRKTPRSQRRHETDSYTGLSTSDSERAYSSLPKKKKMGSPSLEGFSRKRSKNFPPIPRLKIRPALFGTSNSPKVFRNERLQSPPHDSTHFDDSSFRVDADDSSDVSSEDGHNQTWNNLPQTPKTHSEHHQVPQASHQMSKPSLAAVMAPFPPTPQTTVFNHKIPPALLPNPDFATLQYFKANNIRYPIRPPAGARAAREGESVYCYCRCPYDEVSEMIACDGDNCLIEWFHFECVGIMVAPQGKWFCAECRPHYSEDLYPQTVTPNLIGKLREH